MEKFLTVISEEKLFQNCIFRNFKNQQCVAADLYTAFSLRLWCEFWIGLFLLLGNKNGNSLSIITITENQRLDHCNKKFDNTHPTNIFHMKTIIIYINLYVCFYQSPLFSSVWYLKLFRGKLSLLPFAYYPISKQNE